MLEPQEGNLQSLENPHEAGDEPVDVARVVDARGLQHHQRAEQAGRRGLEKRPSKIEDRTFVSFTSKASIPRRTELKNSQLAC